MAEEKEYSYALTSLARVKDLLGIDKTASDIVLIRLINSVTDFIQSLCHRRFLEITYANEVYSINAHSQLYIFLKQRPVSSVASVQYRAGTFSSPVWTAFTADQWALEGDGKSGMIRILGHAPFGTNTVRVSYIAGYKIDFSKYGDTAFHTLPSDVSSLAERLVTRWFKRRESEGKASEGYNGSQVTWQKELGEEDKLVLGFYENVIPFT